MCLNNTQATIKSCNKEISNKCKPKILHERSMQLLENIALESCENSIAAGSQYSPEENPEQWIHQATEASPGLSRWWTRWPVEVPPFLFVQILLEGKIDSASDWWDDWNKNHFPNRNSQDRRWWDTKKYILLPHYTVPS